MKRILIDGRFVGVGESMTRYCLEILRGILMLDDSNQYTLLLRPEGEAALEDYPGIVTADNLKIDILDIPHYSVAEQTKLLNYLNKERFDLVHFIQFNHPVRYKRPYVVTVHDLTMVGYLHRSNPVKRIAFGAVMKSAVRDAREVITVSEYSKKEIVDYYHTNPEKIEVIYNGLDQARYNNRIANKELRIKEFKDNYKIGGKYLLYTGAWKKHKNLKRLLQAFEKFLKFPLNSSPKIGEAGWGMNTPQLVLVGKPDDRESEVMVEIKRINNEAMKQWSHEAIITTGYIDESDLPIAYAGALAYVIPSLSEGFGLPPLEAMACGTPVISSKESCMPEILGEAAYYFDPYSIDDITQAITTIASDAALRDQLIRKGLVQAGKYSWDKAAKATLEVYKETLAQGEGCP